MLNYALGAMIAAVIFAAGEDDNAKKKKNPSLPSIVKNADSLLQRSGVGAESIQTCNMLFSDGPTSVRITVKSLSDTKDGRWWLRGYFDPKRPAVTFLTQEEIHDLDRLDDEIKIEKKRQRPKKTTHRDGTPKTPEPRLTDWEVRERLRLNEMEREREAIVARNRRAIAERREVYEKVDINAQIPSDLLPLLDRKRIVDKVRMEVLFETVTVVPGEPDDSIGRPAIVIRLDGKLVDIDDSFKLDAPANQLPTVEESKPTSQPQSPPP